MTVTDVFVERGGGQGDQESAVPIKTSLVWVQLSEEPQSSRASWHESPADPEFRKSLFRPSKSCSCSV